MGVKATIALAAVTVIATLAALVALRTGVAYVLARRDERATNRVRSHPLFDDQFVRILLSSPEMEETEFPVENVESAASHGT